MQQVAYVRPEQTLTIKGVRTNMLKSVQEAVIRETNPKLGITHVHDKDPSCAGQCLVYANYDSGRACLAALDKLRRLADDKFPGSTLKIMRKSDMQSPAFAVYIANALPGVGREEMADFFSRFGPLHPCTPVVCIAGSDNAFFVNFLRYEGAVTALEAERNGALRFGGSVMMANAARNTTFIDSLLASLQKKSWSSFTHHDALGVRNEMRTQDWPPNAADVEKLVKAVPECFVIDRDTMKYRLRNDQLALAPSSCPSPDRGSQAKSSKAPGFRLETAIVTSPGIRVEALSPGRDMCPEESQEGSRKKLRKKAVDDLVHDNFELLHVLFENLWLETKGRVWEESAGGISSSSAVKLQEELYLQELPPNMSGPVCDWDLSSLFTALSATSLKAKLDDLCARTSSPREVARDDVSRNEPHKESRFMVLVAEKIITSADLEKKYASCFAAASKRAPQALQTIRFVRNILSHPKGSAKGLSQESFDALWNVTTEAFETLARVLYTSHPKAVSRFHRRCSKILDALNLESLQIGRSMLSADGCLGLPMSSSSSSSASSSTIDDVDNVTDNTSVCTSECRSESDSKGVESWSQAQVLSFFQRRGFPTEGVEAGKIDGAALLELYHADDALELFTAPVPDGLGFNKLMFRGSFKSEMAKLAGPAG